MNNKQLLIIPLLLLVYFFAHYTFELYYFLEPIHSLKQFILYITVTGFIFFAGHKVFKNKQRFILSFTTVLFLFLFFGSIVDTFVSAKLIAPVANVGIGLITVYLAVCVLVVFTCYRLKESFVKRLLNFWLIYFAIVLVYDTGVFFLSKKKEKNYLAAASHANLPATVGKPSVFFLLFDMYPSDTVLKKYQGYDNSAIGSFLKKKNFFVTGNAHSLYTETYYSLPSTLSLQPLPYFDDSTIEDYKKKLIALKNIQQAYLPVIFENSGYVFRNYSLFTIRDKPSPLHFNLNYHLDNILTASTFFNRVYDGFEPDFFLASRNIDLGFLKNSWSKNVKMDIGFLGKEFNLLLDSFSDFKRPSFNYFHFMMPHPPVIYDSSGHENPVKDMYAYNGFERSNQNFTNYIVYANREIEKMVNKIFQKAGSNTIIIIQGDHGYREFHDRFPDAVRYGVLNAVYLPSANYGGFNDSMTLLQTFRQLLQNQFKFKADK
jgi:hypothetical protein